MKFKFLLLMLVCATLSAVAQTNVSGSFVYGGLARSYIVYVPAIYNGSTAVPLVFNLHGYTSNNAEQELYADFRAIADTANFLIVLPNGTPDNSGNLFWNDFDLTAVDDVGFISALLDTVSAHYNVDPEAVYSTGMSNGGFLSNDLACSLGNRIAAIASVAGTLSPMHLTACNPPRPISAMHIHGTADATVPYDGNALFTPAENLVQHWVQHDNCSPTPTVTEVPNTNLTDGCTATHYVYSGGDQGTTVEFYKIQGGGHSWPGAPININTTNMDFSASKEIWRFFRQHRLSGATAVEPVVSAPTFAVFQGSSTNAFTVRFNDASKRFLTVNNAIGQLVYRATVTNAEEHVQIRQRGIYCITVSDGKTTRTQKVLVD